MPTKKKQDLLEKGIMKLLVININLSHLWSDLQNNITKCHSSTCIHGELYYRTRKWKNIKTCKTVVTLFTFSRIFAFMVFWSSYNKKVNQKVKKQSVYFRMFVSVLWGAGLGKRLTRSQELRLCPWALYMYMPSSYTKYLVLLTKRPELLFVSQSSAKNSGTL